MRCWVPRPRAPLPGANVPQGSLGSLCREELLLDEVELPEEKLRHKQMMVRKVRGAARLSRGRTRGGFASLGISST